MTSFSSFKSTAIATANETAGVSTGGVDVYDSTGLLPYVGNESGAQAFVNSNNRLYIWQGAGWYNVALLNVAPAISSVQDSDAGTTPFALSSEGAVTRITVTAADSDGDPITYSATADSDFNGLATISNSDNVFTITPLSEDSATTESGTITFKATDDVNIASSGVQTFTLVFPADWSSGGGFAQQTTLVASDAQNDDYFGESVSISGETIVAGASQEDETNTQAGALYVFTRSGSTWTQQQKILQNGSGGDRLGESVSISDDTIVAGAIYEDSPVSNAGSVFVFKRSGSTWSQEADIPYPADRISAGMENFGYAVAVSGDYLVASARRYDTSPYVRSGAMHVYVRSGSSWTEQAILKPTDGASNQYFGSVTHRSVAIDGDTAVGVGAGGCYVFTRSGSTWTQQQKLDNSLSLPAVSIDGDNLAFSDGTAVQVWTRSGSTWTLQQTITGFDPDVFWVEPAIKGDVLLIGSNGSDGDQGRSYIYTRSGSTWSQQQSFQGSNTIANDRFGYAVALESEIAVVATPYQGSNEKGMAYVFIPG